MKTNISRRDAITGLLATGAAFTLKGESVAQTDTPGSAFAGKHEPKPLPFDPGKLTGISEKLITSHHDNNYVGAVRALNVVEQHLAEMGKIKDLPAYLYGDLKREELIRTGSIVLHEKYFANLGGNGKADGAALKLIQHWFGSFEAWEAEFKRTGNALGGGAGWTVLAFNLHTKELHNYWAADHSNSSATGIPILVLDMYEHAYQMDYGAGAAKYVDAFMQNVNWEEANRRVEAVQKINL